MALLSGEVKSGRAGTRIEHAALARLTRKAVVILAYRAKPALADAATTASVAVKGSVGVTAVGDSHRMPTRGARRCALPVVRCHGGAWVGAGCEKQRDALAVVPDGGAHEGGHISVL